MQFSDALYSMIFFNLILLFIILGLDDLFIDIYFWLKRPFPKKYRKEDIDEILLIKEKRIAVMIAAWKEEDVIGQMLTGNKKNIIYDNYHFFVGVYPNDRETQNAVLRAQKKVPNITLVVNEKEGPTSKGQMLNFVLKEIDKTNKENVNKETFEFVVFHDCEDMIHPLSLKFLNSFSGKFDFIQIPIFSLSVGKSNLVAGCYMDEFAECHLKDLPVRLLLTQRFPSAGVGTAMSRKMLDLYKKNKKDIFYEKSLTEDYILGLTLFDELKSLFFTARIESSFFEKMEKNSWFKNLSLKNKKYDFLATREFFPKRIIPAIKQRARWTTGIVFQGTEIIGFKKKFFDNLFLWRDRKGLFSSSVVIFSFFYFIFCFSYSIDLGLKMSSFYLIIFIPLLMMINRVLQRAFFSTLVYGAEFSVYVFFKIILSNIVNFVASWRSFYQYFSGKILKRQLTWSKTGHEILTDFGDELKEEIS